MSSAAPLPLANPAARGSPDASTSSPLLTVEALRFDYRIRRGGWLGGAQAVRAVDEVSFAIGAGETLGLVGESGCGKSTLARLLLRLLDPASGRIVFDGQPVQAASGSALSAYRRQVQAVFQDPYSSLNPRMRVGDIVAEPLDAAQPLAPTRRAARIAELMQWVGLDPAWAGRYPHQFSGGQRQRIAIARGIALNPRLLVLDEPVSALDVSVRAQILNLLRDLQQRLGLSYLLISHDLPIVARMSTHIAVMYLGRIVESGRSAEVARSPRHPYTQALFSAVPPPHPRAPRARIRLSGEVPSPLDLPTGCRFHTRCPQAESRCRQEEPAWAKITPAHRAACHLVPDTSPRVFSTPEPRPSVPSPGGTT